MLEATETYFWQRVAGKSGLKGVTNKWIREIMQVMHTIVIGIKNRQLMMCTCARDVWNSYSEKVINWKPPERRKPGRPRRKVGRKA